jgi:hypothetical protein
MHKIILLNAPPQAGKDTAATFLVKHLNARHFKMSEPLKRCAHALLSLGEQTWMRYNDNGKDERSPAFLGLSPRQFYIILAEQAIKPAFGSDVFGRLAVSMLQQPTSCRVTVISDTGFLHEVHPIIQAYGRSKSCLVRISREGCTFEGDSRSYLEIPECTQVEVRNDYTLDVYENQLFVALRGFIDVSDFREESTKRSEYASFVDGLATHSVGKR